MLKVSQLSIQSAEVTLLSPISFELKKGKIVGVIGASGSGKSLLAQAILGSAPRGFELSGDVQLPQRHAVALAAQSANVLDPLRKVITQLRRRLHGGTIAYNRLNKLSLINEQIAHCYPYQLSGGMAKKALMAQASWQQTAFIVADEPCCGLDDANASELYQQLLSMARQEYRGVLVISHNLKQLLAIADEILVLRDGMLVEITTPQKIVSGIGASYTQKLWQAMPSNWGTDRVEVA